MDSNYPIPAVVFSLPFLCGHESYLSLLEPYAGFQIDSHTCWQAFSDACSPFPPSPIEQCHRLLANRALADVPHFATASLAIQHAILPKKTVILTRAGWWQGITTGEATDVLSGENYDPILGLLALLNAPASAFKQLDDSSFGAHCIKGRTTALGLLLLGRHELHPTDIWQTIRQPKLLKEINPKAAEKFCARLRLFKIPVLSVKARSIAFNTFAHSVILYTSSYFGTAQSDLAMLRTAAADLILGRSWLRHDLLAYVFRWPKISRLLDPGLSILVSALGLYLRKGGQPHCL